MSSQETKDKSPAVPDNALSGWLSTYGLVTATRVLGRCHIHLQQEEITRVILSPNTFYHQLIQVPLKNVLNGIVLEQAQDYRIYMEKLFADYFLSEHAADKSMDDPGFQLAQNVEAVRLSFVALSETFQQQIIDHRNLIAKSQKHLIEIAGLWEQHLKDAMSSIRQHLALSSSIELDIKLRQVLHLFLIFKNPSSSPIDLQKATDLLGRPLTPELENLISKNIEELQDFMRETISPLNEYTDAVSATLTSLVKFRAEFYALILQIHELIVHLPHPALDLERLHVHRQSLFFDLHLGEKDQ